MINHNGPRPVAVAAALFAVLLAPAVFAQDAAKSKSHVPRWDASGALPLPWQGISCLDINDDATSIAVGTIAPAGDPNVFLFDKEGNLVHSAAVGQRWIQQVAVDGTGKGLHALCTMPAGKAGDFPTVFYSERGAKGVVAIRAQLGENGWPGNLFHYGAHSNHTGVILRGQERGAAFVYGDRAVWLEDGKIEAQVSFPRAPALGSEGSVTTAMTMLCAGSPLPDKNVGPCGRVLVGCTSPAGEKARANLFLLSPQARNPVWSRTAVVDTDRVKPPAKGAYGTPTLPDGSRAELPQKDVEVFAPLSLAMEGMGEPRLIAVADYPGWQRWIRSSATMQWQHYGTRFEPARPTISIHDGQGKLLRRFGPQQFNKPVWVDLCFAGKGKYLLAYPHNWTCRGLAGQTILPADDDARTLYILEIETGAVRSLEFPDAISDVAAGPSGPVVVGCWNGTAYALDSANLSKAKLPAGMRVSISPAPLLVRISRDGTRLVIAAATGEIRLVERDDKSSDERLMWHKKLAALVKPGLKPWVANARAEKIGDGVWNLPGGRVESDLGGQRVVEGPDGLILIEGHSGLSFEREWAAMKSVGLDPTRVKYVLATHEHGDHAPGAYLWRVVTGAKFVCSEEMAYTLQHHLPLSSGYGFHPPVPTDIVIKQDTELDLAGVKVKAVRLPGHTFGSMGWMFTRGDRTYIAFGDLIMPDGSLGYSGTVNFSARDVLASLRKLRELKPNFALAGHGPMGNPDRYLAAGIEVGVRVGWGKMRPERPDPYFRIGQKNVQVVGWNIEATSADFGDLDGDGRADIALVAPDGDGAVVKIFLNKGGKFAQQPDHVVPLPGVASPSKIRVRQLRLSDGKRAGILVGGKTAALLLPEGNWPDFRTFAVPMGDANHIHSVDLDGDGTRRLVVCPRFGSFQVMKLANDRRISLSPMAPEVRGPYADFQMLDLNGDGRTDLVTSSGKVHLRQANGKFAVKPDIELAVPDEKDWTFLAVGDFNADGRPDVVLASYGMQQTRLSVFYNTGARTRPFDSKPGSLLNISDPGKKNQPPLLRDNPVATDWNSDGTADLIIGKGQDNQVLILLGGPEGLNLKRSAKIGLDYRVHYETGLHVADFSGTGRMDLGCLGYTSTGVGQGGPLAVYIWRQP